MRLLRIIALRLRSLIFGGRLDAETREELRAHSDRQVALHLASGMSLDEARRAASIEIGDVTRLAEACRDARGLAWWDATRADVRHAVRQIRLRPGFASAAILTIALGVGATAAVFAVADTVLFRPLPYPEPDRLVAVYEVNSRGNIGRTRATALNFLDWRAQAKSFAGMAGMVGTGFTLGGPGDPEFALGQLVTPNLLDVLRVQPILGRAFQPHEADAGSHRVVILTHELWQRRFGGDGSIVGRTTIINSEPYHVIGVLPASFSYPTTDYELLTPLVTKGELPGAPPMNRVARYLRVVARLGDGVDDRTAREELALIGGRLADAFPDTNENVTIGMTSLAADMVAGAEADLVVALAAAGVVLLVACLNTAGLAIARGSARARELAVRAAIGASRARLIRQLATEALVTFVIGAGAGLALAALCVALLAPTLPASLPRMSELTLDWRFAAFGLLLTLGAGLLFSVVPALSLARRGPLADFDGSRRVVSAGRATQRTRGALIVLQVAAAIVLLAGAALAVRSFDRVRQADAGFEPAQTMTFGVVMRDRQYPTADDMRAFVARVGSGIGALPGIEAAGVTTHLPLSDQNLENSFTVDGSPVATGGELPIAGLRGVDGRYRAAIGARLVGGRDLSPADTAASQPVVVVTADFVRRHVRAADPIGARLKMGGADSDDPWRTIVGVIADIRHNELDQAPRPEVWLPYAQMPDDVLTTWLRGIYVAARTAIDPPAAVPVLRATMRALDPAMPLVDMQSLGELAQVSTAERRLGTYLLAAFASLALVLAAIGLFGVLAFHVVQHVPEFGVRLALGATPRGLLALVFRRGLILVAIGMALGIPGAIAMGSAMSALLYEVTPYDPVALAGALAVLSIVALAACALPAYRAMKTDPLTAIRAE